ncbi:MAG: heme exporter protein CcmB [Candidatus Neomarinimicrobiota bacterium]
MLFKLIYNEFYLESKSSYNLFYMSFFAISCLMFLLFTFPLSKINDIIIFNGFLWIIVALSSIKLIENSFARERDFSVYDLIYSSSIDLSLVFLSKLFTLNMILAGVQLILLFIYILFTSLNFDIVFNFIPLCVLANFGLIGFGILIFLLTNTSTSKSFLFPVIFFPIIIPILINSSNIALGLIIQDTASLYIESWLILLTFALLGVLLGINLFGRLIKQ